MGTSPCNQVANGLFLRLNGQIQICPGRSDENSVYSNIHRTDLKEIWVQSFNYSLGSLSNSWCMAKKQGMPFSVQTQVLEMLEEKYR